MTSEVKWPVARPGLQNFWHAKRFPRLSAFTVVLANLFYSFARPESQYCEECVCVCVCVYIYIYIYIYISDFVQVLYALPFIPKNNASSSFLHRSEAVRSVDWILITEGAGLAVTGRICDIGQNIIQHSFQTRSSSSHSYF